MSSQEHIELELAASLLSNHASARTEFTPRSVRSKVFVAAISVRCSLCSASRQSSRLLSSLVGGHALSHSVT